MRHRKLKTKLHFNRIAMQRNDPRVWSAKNAHACNMSEKIVVKKDGVVILETVFKPEATQPRAYFVAYGVVTQEDGVTVVNV